MRDRHTAANLMTLSRKCQVVESTKIRLMLAFVSFERLHYAFIIFCYFL